MEVGNRDSDAEVDGLQKKETEYDADGRLKLEVERDSVKLQLQNLLVDMNESLRRLVGAEEGARVGAEEGTSVEIRRELQLEAKRRLAEFEELLWRRKKEKKKEKRRVNSGGREEGRVVQQLLRTLNQVAREISRQLMEYEDLGGSKDGGSKATIEVDSAMGNSVEGLNAGRSRKGKEARKARKIQKGLEKYEEWRREKDEEERLRDPEEVTDHYAYEARLFEKRWNMVYSTGHGCFEDNTSIPCKRFTVNPAPDGGFTRATLQVFSVKVTKLTGGLQWPLNVFGLVALRDSLDRNRNVIFKRERDNCQTLTAENPYLVLTGPVRGVVFCDPVILEVSLYVRGTTDSDDKELSLLAPSIGKVSTHPLKSSLIKGSYTSRLSTLVFVLGHIPYSVEATISVKVISGPRPDDFHGQFTAVTEIQEEIVLLDSGDENVPISGDEIELSRCVVSVESSKKLRISVKAWQGGRLFCGGMDFTPQEMGTSFQTLDIGFCKIEVTVDWSLFSWLSM